MTCAVLQLVQIQGPLKLAVESGDLDFCSAALVRNLCEKVFTGTCILDSEPPPYERKVRHSPTFECQDTHSPFATELGTPPHFCRVSTQPLKLFGLLNSENTPLTMPEVTKIHEAYNHLRDGGKILWANTILNALYATALVAYRPAATAKVPAVRFIFELIVHCAVIWTATHAQPLQPSMSWAEIVMYVYMIGVLLSEVSQLRRGGLQRYTADAFNVIDSLIFAGLAATLTLRLKAGPSYAQITMSFTSIMLSLRLLPFLKINRSIGPLVNVITAMAKLLLIFLVVLLIVLSGFIVGMSGLLGDVSDAYDGLILTSVTLFNAALGNCDKPPLKPWDLWCSGQADPAPA